MYTPELFFTWLWILFSCSYKALAINLFIGSLRFGPGSNEDQTFILRRPFKNANPFFYYEERGSKLGLV